MQHTRTGARLLRGLDPKKDQSYVLYALRPDIIDRLILPLGEKTKQTVREIAHKLSLPSSNRPESQEICFIEERNYAAYMDGLAEEAKGPVIDIADREADRKPRRYTSLYHRPKKALTGHRKTGLRREYKALSKCHYMGPREMAQMKEFTVHNANWIADPTKGISGQLLRCALP